MDAMKEIYVVTAGDYSDYHIVAVFDDRELADACALAIYDDEAVEVFTLNPDADRWREGLTPWSVIMHENGDVVDARVEYPPHDAKCAFPAWKNQPGTQRGFGVWARSKEHAVKVANERRVNLIATDRWNTKEQP